MTLPLNKETVAAAYDFLRTTPPFTRWNLPDSDDVGFLMVRSHWDFARYRWDGKRHTISVSHRAIGHTDTLFEKLAHELIHLHLEETGMESKSGDGNTHNAAFKKFAAQVCKIHGFDPKAFY